MINLEYEIPKFGDTEYLERIKRKKNIEKTKITIDLKRLMSIGISKEQAINLIERLIKK